ncbi:MAG: hypothetical protein QOE92_2569 [Chloroflexota bacterium]|jgi:peptidoglycan/LPS O-acetylase OafA/YrhL|nr:hypothetical protein [Chloroflexota bacterium]
MRSLDACRGAAASLVVSIHALLLLLVGAARDVREVVLTARGLVILFFLISGFCIHYQQVRGFRDRPSSAEPRPLRVRRYARRRFLRIYPAVVAAIAFTLACDALGLLIAPDMVSGHTGLFYIDFVFNGTHYTPMAIISAVFVQGGVFAPSIGTNGPLWSLGFEVWYYALYPVLWLTSRGGVKRGLSLVAIVSITALGGELLAGWYGVAGVLARWGIWYAGALLAEAYVGKLRMPPRYVYLPVAAGLIWAHFALSWRLEFYDYGAAFFCMFLLQTILTPGSRLKAQVLEAFNGAFEAIGRMAFSLFLVHFPWLSLLSVWWLTTHQGHLPNNPLLVVFGITSSFGLAVVFYRLVEKRFRNENPRQERSRLAEMPLAAN